MNLISYYSQLIFSYLQIFVINSTGVRISRDDFDSLPASLSLVIPGLSGKLTEFWASSLWVSDFGVSDFLEFADAGQSLALLGMGSFLSVLSDLAHQGSEKVYCVGSVLKQRIPFIFSPCRSPIRYVRHLEGKDHILFIVSFHSFRYKA